MHSLINNIEPGVCDRPSQRNDGGFFTAVDSVRAGPDSCLCRSIHVPRLAALDSTIRKVPRQRFAATQYFQRYSAPPARVYEHAPGGRRGLHNRYAGTFHHRGQDFPVYHFVTSGNGYLRATDERHEQFKSGNIERKSGYGNQDVVTVELKLALHRKNEVDQ